MPTIMPVLILHPLCLVPSSPSVETLRQLIFRDLDDGWSQDTDDTPTNETANERSPFTDGQQPEPTEPANSDCPSQWEAEEAEEAPPPEAEAPAPRVMRKGNETSSSQVVTVK